MTDAAVFQCEDCLRTTSQPADKPAPSCGHLSTDMNRFPDGGWVRIESYRPHGVMHLVHRVPSPFADMMGDEEE